MISMQWSLARRCALLCTWCCLTDRSAGRLCKRHTWLSQGPATLPLCRVAAEACKSTSPWLCMQVFAVFGFCDIRQFTDATEVLQEDVMEFVNSISKIVHMEVSLHGGFPNKNIGDAFLLVSTRPCTRLGV